MSSARYFEHRAEQNLLVFRWPAEAGEDSISALFNELSAQARQMQEGTRRILIDLRKAPDAPSNLAYWVYMSLLPYIVGQRTEGFVRAAFWLANAHQNWRECLPAPMAQELHGFAAEAFHEEGSAMAWLNR